MKTSQIELEKLSKRKLIEMIHEQKEEMAVREECKEILRLDRERF